ncbi:hypothetical protein KAJ27_04705 [bacterium]|nr:hypothetical protein [bacterium]
MKFSKVQERIFKTSEGAYSLVTDREYHDSQITLTDYEAELVISHFGKGNLLIGNVKSNSTLASKKLYLYPTGKTINLNIVFPKPKKTELRLYLSSQASFKPKGGYIWFLFTKNKEIWIGSMPEIAWRSASSELKRDIADSIYQESLDETDVIKITKLQKRDTYARNRNVAIKSMENAYFTCEYDPKHSLFISRFSQKPYLEAHHLIPMGLQNDFPKPLDTVHNVFCLCPYCHRAVHHAEESVARDILKTLADKRPVLNNFNIDVPDLFSLYAIEKII